MNNIVFIPVSYRKLTIKPIPIKMWFTCYICHKTYTMKCNLRCHMYSNHIDKSFNCKYCAKSFKRKDYLKRHISKKHDNKDVFSRIRDCISTECSPEIQQVNYCSAYKSSEYDSVDEFLDTIPSNYPS